MTPACMNLAEIAAYSAERGYGLESVMPFWCFVVDAGREIEVVLECKVEDEKLELSGYGEEIVRHA